MKKYQTFTREDADQIATVTLDCPPINLMGKPFVADLWELVTELDRDPHTRVLIFRSANPDFFLAHYDISPAAMVGPPTPLFGPHMLSTLYTRISQLKQVTIGEVRGRVRGSGNEFLLALDMRFASLERAVLGQPEILVGLHPGAGGTARLAQMAGRGRALEICLTGDDYSAEMAERYGWINRAIPDSEISSYVDNLARRIACLPPRAVASIKSIVARITAIDTATFAEESAQFYSEMATAEASQRIEWGLKQGLNSAGDFEMNLGHRLGRFAPADER
jgi:enoyl-CoA hydratase/carnithine racemase